MSNELLLQQLKSATTSEQKAALVAEAIIGDLPETLRKVAIQCCFMPWFFDKIITTLIGNSTDNSKIRLIVDLPFVEKLSIGYCFHSTTRKGILKKYFSENLVEIHKTFEIVENLLVEESQVFPLAKISLLYGYVL